MTSRFQGSSSEPKPLLLTHVDTYIHACTVIKAAAETRAHFQALLQSKAQESQLEEQLLQQQEEDEDEDGDGDGGGRW